MPDYITNALKAQFLIAMPGMADPNFYRSVTCICEHNRDGAMGVIINRLHPTLTARDILEELKVETHIQAETIPIHLGGPVHPDEIFILHGAPFVYYGSLVVSPSVALSNTMELLRAIAAGTGPRQFLIALGCAGWGPNQLENEIQANAWLSSDLAEDIVFDLEVDARWDAAVRRMGFDPMLLSHQAGHA